MEHAHVHHTPYQLCLEKSCFPCGQLKITHLCLLWIFSFQKNQLMGHCC